MSLVRGDSPDIVKKFILTDKFLVNSYTAVYDLIRRDIIKFSGIDNLKILELGGAGGISETVFPKIIKSDVVYSSDLDLVCNALELPLKLKSVDVIIMKDSFHHLPNINDFFHSVMKILPTGACVYIADPNWNFVSQIVYKFFHPEPFVKSAKDWTTDPSQPWNSNQALLWIVFKRDREILSINYPNFLVEEIGFTTGLSYILSGGVYARNRISVKLLNSLHKAEKKLKIFARFTSLSKIVKITKI